MGNWEQEVFEKEYADMNWYKGKQSKHVKEMEMGRKRSKLGAYPPDSNNLVNIWCLISSMNSLNRAPTINIQRS